jgi:hypothetical protein
VSNPVHTEVVLQEPLSSQDAGVQASTDVQIDSVWQRPSLPHDPGVQESIDWQAS